MATNNGEKLEKDTRPQFADFALTNPRDLAERLTELSKDSRVIVGLAGAPGAGKSTLAAKLKDLLGDSLQILPMDGFHLANEVLIDLGFRDKKGAPNTFDVDGLAVLLQRVRLQKENGPIIYAPRFDRGLEEAISSAIPITSAHRIVLAEGNYLLAESNGWDQVRRLLDETWYLEVSKQTRIERLLARRALTGEPLNAARAWVLQVDVPNGEFTDGTRGHADLIFTLVEDA